MMVRVVIVLAVLAVATSAFPADEYTPEADTDDVNDNILLQATARVHSLMAEGKDGFACRNLARSEQKTIEDDVEALQNVLNDVPTGMKCPQAGQDGVQAAQKAKTDAEEARDLATNARSSAENIQIDFGKRTLSSIRYGSPWKYTPPAPPPAIGCQPYIDYSWQVCPKCAFTTSHSKYTAALANAKTAKDTHLKAEAVVVSAAFTLFNAEKAAKKEKHDCECNVQEKQTAAWELASKENSRAEDYAKATSMLCVLNGEKTCTAKLCPSLTKPKILSGPAVAKCTMKEYTDGAFWKKMFCPSSEDICSGKANCRPDPVYDPVYACGYTTCPSSADVCSDKTLPTAELVQELHGIPQPMSAKGCIVCKD